MALRSAASASSLTQGGSLDTFTSKSRSPTQSCEKRGAILTTTLSHAWVILAPFWKPGKLSHREAQADLEVMPELGTEVWHAVIHWEAQLRDGKSLGKSAGWRDVTDVKTRLYLMMNGPLSPRILPQRHVGRWEASQRHLRPYAKEHYGFSEAPAPHQPFLGLMNKHLGCLSRPFESTGWPPPHSRGWGGTLHLASKVSLEGPWLHFPLALGLSHETSLMILQQPL